LPSSTLCQSAEGDGGGQLRPLFNGTRLPSGDGERFRAEGDAARLAAGDRQAVAEVYARYSHGIYGYISSIVSDRHEAEDLTQQVFLKLMTSAPQADHLDFSAWLLRVARNAAIDSLRRSSRTCVLDPHDWSPGALAPDHDARRALQDAFAALNRNQRDALLLRDLLGLSPHEAAERLGKSDGAVHMLHHRARRAVCERLKRSGAEPSTLGRNKRAA
jgi:RNA polymerase sigma-70 factor, ECF subfamily